MQRRRRRGDGFLVGDPGRITLITSLWESEEKVADNRGLPVWTGSYKGKKKDLPVGKE